MTEARNELMAEVETLRKELLQEQSDSGSSKEKEAVAHALTFKHRHEMKAKNGELLEAKAQARQLEKELQRSHADQEQLQAQLQILKELAVAKDEPAEDAVVDLAGDAEGQEATKTAVLKANARAAASESAVASLMTQLEEAQSRSALPWPSRSLLRA